MPQISVIVPVYNVEKYLNRCIDSILAQSFSEFELILVNDGSTDKSGEICDLYAKNEDRIRVFHQNNQGQAAARNFAVKNSKSNWICFIDSDDMMHPQMLEIMFNVVKETNTQLCMCGAVGGEIPPSNFNKQMREIQSKRIIVNDKSLYDICMKGKARYWIVCAKLIKREIVESVPFTEGRIFEDNAVVPQWLYMSETVADIEKDLYFYQKNLAGTTQKSFSVQSLDFLWAMEEQILFFDSKKCKRMLTAICSHYLKIAPQYYKKTLYELNNQFEAEKIKKKSKNVIKHYYKLLSLNKNEIYEILQMLYPRAMQVYSKIKSKF